MSSHLRKHMFNRSTIYIEVKMQLNAPATKKIRGDNERTTRGIAILQDY